MLAFESLTPEDLLKEVAEYIRLRALQMGLEAHPNFKTNKTRRALAEARENALKSIAMDLEGAAIIPANSILRKLPIIAEAGEDEGIIATVNRATGASEAK